MDPADELLDNSPVGDRQDEQAVILCLQFPIGKLQEQKALDAIFDLDDILRDVIETSGVGRYDGHELCESEVEESVTFYIYGEDAGSIYEEIQPILESLPSLSGFYIIKRFSHIDEENFQLS
jgi:hypothetical protein